MTTAQIIGNGLLLLAGAHGLFFLFAPVAAPRLYLRYTGWGMGEGDDMPWWGMALGGVISGRRGMRDVLALLSHLFQAFKKLQVLGTSADVDRHFLSGISRQIFVSSKCPVDCSATN